MSVFDRLHRGVDWLDNTTYRLGQALPPEVALGPVVVTSRRRQREREEIAFRLGQARGDIERGTGHLHTV